MIHTASETLQEALIMSMDLLSGARQAFFWTKSHPWPLTTAGVVGVWKASAGGLKKLLAYRDTRAFELFMKEHRLDDRLVSDFDSTPLIEKWARRAEREKRAMIRHPVGKIEFNPPEQVAQPPRPRQMGH